MFSRLLYCAAASAAFLVAPVQAEMAVVLNSADATVSLIDRATFAERGRVAVGKEPHHLMWSLDGKSLIVASAAGNELVFLNPADGRIERRVKDIVDPYHLGFSPDRKWLVVNANRLDRVDLYTAEDFKLVKRIPLKRVPSHLAFDRASQYVFVTLQESDELAAIDLGKQAVAWVHKVGRMPAGVWMTPDDRHLLVAITTSQRRSGLKPR